MPINSCPLCFNPAINAFFADKRREYLRCSGCKLVFVPPEQHLSEIQEKAIYDLHQNRIDDIGYRKFLSRVALPLQTRLPQASNGLDYGCGPGPLLAQILEEHGHHVAIYDPLYFPNHRLLENRYDFVTCTEVVEHFREPFREFQRLFQLLKPGGLLALMTKLVISQEAFSRWHYKNDLTHIGFYSDETLHWLATKYGYEFELLGKDVIIFSRRSL